MLHYPDILNALHTGDHAVFAAGSNGIAGTVYSPDAEAVAWGNHPEPHVRALHSICTVWALGRAATRAGFQPVTTQ